MENVITIIKGESIQAFSTLTKACKKNPCFKYSYIKGLKFPFNYKGFKFLKLKINP